MRVLNETRIQKHKLTSTQVIALGFLGAILVGTLLLLIPVATAKGGASMLRPYMRAEQLKVVTLN